MPKEKEEKVEKKKRSPTVKQANWPAKSINWVVL